LDPIDLERRPPPCRFSAAKAILVILAMLVNRLLEPVRSHPQLVTGIALVVAVATLGPLLHP